MMLPALAAAGALLACPTLDGVERLKPGAGVIVWVGELHGTTEQPALFGDLVCNLAKDDRVFVALERSVTEQSAWNVFFSSDGGTHARETFVRDAGWLPPIHDGRNSSAMLSLAERLRLLHAQGRISAVRLILQTLPSGSNHAAFEKAMADAVGAAAAEAPGARLLVLSGNAHARRWDITVGAESYRSAAGQLAPGSVVSVYLSGGAGSAWNCQGDGCGPHPYSGKALPRGVAVAPAPLGYDVLVATGVPTTASLPASTAP